MSDATETHLDMLDGKQHEVTWERHRIASTKVACPYCGASPLRVIAANARDCDGYWEADARSRCCDQPVGTLIDPDEALRRKQR